MIAFLFLTAFDCSTHIGGVAGYRAHLAHCGTAEAAALTTQLVAFPTVNLDEHHLAQAPAFTDLENFLRTWAQDHGLRFAVIGARDAFQLTLGDGNTLAIIAHGDVEPASPKTWHTDPFTAVMIGDKLFGRGTEDDKGPLAAALVAVDDARLFGLPMRGIRIAIGTSEETSADPMRRYAALPQALNNISIDGEFPVVAGQFGYVSWHLRMPLGTADGAAITRIEAGEFLTQVPGHAQATIAHAASFAEALRVRAGKLRLKNTITANGDMLTVIVEGKAAHASVPEEGDNALLALAELVRKLPVASNGYKKLVDILTDDIGYDIYARKLGLAYEDPVMGKLVIAPTLVREVDGFVELGVNLRRPAGMTADAFRARLHAAAEKMGVSEGEVYVGDPHLADTSGPLVKTLLAIYAAHEGKKAEPRIDRGGTYAKLFTGAVDFGPSFPDLPYLGHADNEYITMRELAAQTEMLGEAIIALALR